MIGARPSDSSSIIKQPGPGDERLAQGEHLLLATRQVAGRLVPALAQHGEELEHLLGGLGEVLGVAGDTASRRR